MLATRPWQPHAGVAARKASPSSTPRTPSAGTPDFTGTARAAGEARSPWASTPTAGGSGSQMSSGLIPTPSRLTTASYMSLTDGHLGSRRSRASSLRARRNPGCRSRKCGLSGSRLHRLKSSATAAGPPEERGDRSQIQRCSVLELCASARRRSRPAARAPSASAISRCRSSAERRGVQLQRHLERGRRAHRIPSAVMSCQPAAVTRSEYPAGSCPMT